ncbi:putative Concanavalin A like lectin glucanases superfamily [Trypanosoma vivax]|uniref:Uncharacterized protein n=1 Tax=Trypanosoma vivax (strain Y486) TaxID=1055687 RepID=G0U3N9_TRYVY|nr:putative Concanavalin A like lectin glucanases superfamily [Trypanosoma vivax]CCC50896.1 conserved hypothetical protein [Trypanosoma vivax Y486]
MRCSINKQSLSDLARRVIDGIRCLVIPNWVVTQSSRRDLLSVPKTIKEQWKKKQIVADMKAVEIWVESFSEELRYHLGCSVDGTDSRVLRHAQAGNGFSILHNSPPFKMGKPAQSGIEEATMLVCMEALRVLVTTVVNDAACMFSRYGLITLIANYLIRIPMGRNMREALSSSLLFVASHNTLLLEEFTYASKPLLTSKELEGGVNMVAPQQVHLACVLAGAFRQADVCNTHSESVRIECGRDGFLSSLLRISSALARDATEVGGGAGLTASLAYLTLAGAMVCGCTENKTFCLSSHRADLVSLWVVVASNASRADMTLRVPTNVPGCDAFLAIESSDVWVLELVDLLVEVATSDSFSSKRRSVGDNLSACSTANQNACEKITCCVTNAIITRNSSSPSHSLGSTAPPGGYVYMLLTSPSISWDAAMEEGSRHVWNLASLLFNCMFTGDGCDLVAEILLRIETADSVAGRIYRYLILTLMLLCTATPHNAKALARSPVMDALIARLAQEGSNVFLNKVIISGKEWRPKHVLSANCSQFSLTFMNLLTSLYISEGFVPKLMSALEELGTQQVSSVDVDIVESFINVTTLSRWPQRMLFFSGAGFVFSKVSDVGSGRSLCCSFSAWILPKCVWEEGCSLFSYSDQRSESSVTLIIVANGRSCGLLLQTKFSKEVNRVRVTDASFSADTWSHVALIKDGASLLVYVNGRCTRNTLPTHTLRPIHGKTEVEFSLGGVQGEPSFFGFTANIELLNGALTEEDVFSMYRAGFVSSQELKLPCCPLLHITSGAATRSGNRDVNVTCGMGQRYHSFVHNVVSFDPPSTLEVFLCNDVVKRSLTVLLTKRRTSEDFLTAAGLALGFLCAAMKLAKSEQELCHVAGESVVRQLQEEVLSWSRLPPPMSSLLVGCTIPCGDKRLMRDHSTTQIILSLLLSVIGAMRVTPHDMSSLLRELSDVLLFPENVIIFQSVPGRLEQLLAISAWLPVQCTENLIVLVERLCKGPHEIEQVLRFLLIEPVSDTHETVKVGMLHMLFDIARTNPSICDLIRDAFGNEGILFLICLAGGMGHSSESIRLFSLRLISLMLHTCSGLRETFIQLHGYEVLAAMMANEFPSTVPVTFLTFECLFQMALDVFQPVAESGASELQSGHAVTPKGCQRSPNGQGPNDFCKGGSGGSKGYIPGLVPHHSVISRRKYSLEVSSEIGHEATCLICAGTVHQRSHGSRCGDNVLKEPLVLYPLLCLLGKLVQGAVESSRGSIKSAQNSASIAKNANVVESETAMGHCYVVDGDDSPDSTVPGSPREGESPLVVAHRVLSYVERIAVCNESGELLLSFPWLTWMWGTLHALIGFGCDNATNWNVPSFSCPVGDGGLGVVTVFSIQKRLRSIIRRLAILDLSRNKNANVVRTISQAGQPAALVRMLVEDIATYFATSTCGFKSEEEALNIVKNLDSLFGNIENILRPLPAPLVLRVIDCISVIAVKNNSWVRLQMKESSRLFETRARLGLLLMSTAVAFCELPPVALVQLLEAVEREQDVVRVLFRRLVAAASAENVEEVSILLAMVRFLTEEDPAKLRGVRELTGEKYRSFTDLVCHSDTNKGEEVVINTPPRNRLLTSLVLLGSVKENAEPLRGASVTRQIIRWGRENRAMWKELEQGISERAKFVDTTNSEEKTGGTEWMDDLSSRARCAREESRLLEACVEARRVYIIQRVYMHLSVSTE